MASGLVLELGKCKVRICSFTQQHLLSIGLLLSGGFSNKIKMETRPLLQGSSTSKRNREQAAYVIIAPLGATFTKLKDTGGNNPNNVFCLP